MQTYVGSGFSNVRICCFSLLCNPKLNISVVLDCWTKQAIWKTSPLGSGKLGVFIELYLCLVSVHAMGRFEHRRLVLCVDITRGRESGLV